MSVFTAVLILLLLVTLRFGVPILLMLAYGRLVTYVSRRWEPQTA